MPTSPTQRTLKRIRDAGATAAVAEYWLRVPNHPGGGVRRDLFGFIDVVALWPGEGTIGIQATSGSNGRARVRKIATECRDNALAWLAQGNRIQVWDWRKLKGKWEPRIVEVTVDLIEAEID